MRGFTILTNLVPLCFSLPLNPPQQQPITAPIGISQPLIGFGTWNLKTSASNTSRAVSLALQHGYRQIDCAAAYGNEVAVGQGIADGLKRANLRREQIWVTSKLWNDHHSPVLVEEGLKNTLKDLGVEYLDLYLMHWPVGSERGKFQLDYVNTWLAMEKLLHNGLVHNIGISNFSPHQLKTLIKHTSVKPAVHQMEMHPYLQQPKWLNWHRAQNIAVTAYSPLGNMNPTYHNSDPDAPPLLLENEVLNDIAKKRECTPSQVALAWGISRGTSVIPKTKHEEFMKENIGAETCVLQKSDFGRIEKEGETWLTRFNNPGKGWGVKLFEGLDGA